MGLFDYFKKNDKETYFNDIIGNLAQDYKNKHDEKSAAAFLKGLVRCDIYVPVKKDTYSEEEDAVLYPLMRKIDNQLVMLMYTKEPETIDDGYIIVKMGILQALRVYDTVTKLKVDKILLDENDLNVIINDAFVRYMRLVTKKKFF